MPRLEVVRRALDEIRRRSVSYEYFFDRLNSPDWIEPLRCEGMFKDPPPVEREGDYIRFPAWPESRYLARIASAVPELVRDIALSIETENVRVHEDLVQAALVMPTEIAAPWARKEARWLRSQTTIYLGLPSSLGALVARLAKGAQGEVALGLAKTLLAIPRDPGAAEPDSEGDGTYLPLPEARARFGTWEYGEILKNYVPDLQGVRHLPNKLHI